jgi:3-deoxy-D-manno-octulosonic-acid transferase
VAEKPLSRAVPAPVRLDAAARAKWQLFRLLEWLSDLRGNATGGQLDFSVPAAPTPALWVFVSTIGELNAVDPFLRQLAAQLHHLKLVLITDHAHYRSSYESLYPSAAVCVTHGHGDDAPALARHYPPAALVVAEIPCMPSDAPCRFSFAFVREAKRAGAPAFLVNGWLYHYKPACRLDAVELLLFRRHYLRAFDMLCVQTEDARRQLLGAGASVERIAVVGNIKFDSMQRPQWRAAGARSPLLLSSLLSAGRPVIVAGCVTSAVEQQMVLDAFATVRAEYADALLVIAPRHPEVAERMKALDALLTERGLVARFRSKLEDGPLAAEVDCLVLDTMGDLRDFYAAATVAHVGVDHNVLEPLGFGKPVTVAPGWESTYPSYPVYRMLSDERALLEARDAAALAHHWKEAIANRAAVDASIGPAQVALERARGAVERHFSAMRAGLQSVMPT